ncbi:hypothetical protein MRX96_007581 [Rhipicephalus microplus]
MSRSRRLSALYQCAAKAIPSASRSSPPHIIGPSTRRADAPHAKRGAAVSTRGPSITPHSALPSAYMAPLCAAPVGPDRALQQLAGGQKNNFPGAFSLPQREEHRPSAGSSSKG